MLNDIALLLVLILVNGAFAMSEIAIVSARRIRLAHMAETGNRGAKRALALAAEPTKFLSSVQVGITTIGILSGAIGGASISARLHEAFTRSPMLAPYADTLSIAALVVPLTYVSVVVGELAPKRLALTHPETLASLTARPMQVLAGLGRPIVYLLSASTDGLLRLLGTRPVGRPAVTLEEVKVLIEQATEQGVVERAEHDMVTNVFNLDERRVGSVLTPRSDVVFLDLRDPIEQNREKLQQSPHAILPLCDDGLDHVVGFVPVARLLDPLFENRPLDFAAVAEPPLFVPESMTLMTLLEQFKRTHLPIACVVDEFGGFEGLVSLTDVFSSIVGELPTTRDEEPMAVRREDGSWLLDGGLDLDSVIRTLGSDTFVSEEDRQVYHTLGGLVMLALGRVPRTGDHFDRGTFRFEVVDMDGRRVDRVMVSPLTQPPTTAPDAL